MSKIVHNTFFPNGTVKIVLMLTKEEDAQFARLSDARLTVIEAARDHVKEEDGYNMLLDASIQLLEKIEQEGSALNPDLLTIPHDT